MSATPIPYPVLLDLSRAPDRARRESGALPIRGSPRWRRMGPGSAEQRKERCSASGTPDLHSALDVGRPGLLDQLDHRLRHRNVVEILRHLVALGESPFEELDGLEIGRAHV